MKALEYNNNIIKQRENNYKKKIKKYYNHECSYNQLKEENKKLFADYKKLDKIICEELKINK